MSVRPCKGVPYRYAFIANDPLHAFLNVTSKLIERVFYFPMKYDSKTTLDRVMKVKEKYCEELNSLLKTCRIGVKNFNCSDKDGLPKFNGNNIKAVFSSKDFIYDALMYSRVVNQLELVQRDQRSDVEGRVVEEAAAEPAAAAAPAAPKKLTKLQRQAERFASAIAESSAKVAREEAAMPAQEPEEEGVGEEEAEARAEEHMQAVQQAAESVIDIRNVDAWESLIQMWQFVVSKDDEPHTEEECEQAKSECHRLAVAMAQAVVAVTGEADHCSYLHDMVYAWPHVVKIVKLLLRVSMEGFEHANKVMGAIIEKQTSKSGRAPKEGLRKNMHMQALEHRRSGTCAVREIGLLNRYSRARCLLMPPEFYEIKKLDPEMCLDALGRMRVEIEARGKGDD